VENGTRSSASRASSIQDRKCRKWTWTLRSSRASHEFICIRRSPVRFITDYCLDTSNTVNFTRKTTRRLRAPMQLPLHSYLASLSRCNETSTGGCLIHVNNFAPLALDFPCVPPSRYTVTCASHDPGALAGRGKRPLYSSYEEERRALPCLTRSLPRTKERKRRVAAW